MIDSAVDCFQLATAWAGTVKVLNKSEPGEVIIMSVHPGCVHGSTPFSA